MAHAILAPSAAARWLTCTPSAQLEAKEPYTESVYADEGTLAHRLCELLIDRKLGRVLEKDYKAQLKKIEADKLYAGDMFDFCDGFSVYVLELYNKLRDAGKDPVLFTEDRVDLTRWVPGGFGTVDVRILANGELFVLDYKHGKGVPVFADENSQLKLYALGAAEELAHLYEIKEVTLVIYQPRIDNISDFKISFNDLENWGIDYVIPRAREAWHGKGEFVPGSHCQFCRVKPKCRALAEYNLKIAQEAFKEPALLSAEEIAEIVTKEKFFTDWLSAVTTFALDQAINKGVNWPGLKLVEGRSIRKYTDPLKVIEALRAAGVSDEFIFKTPALEGITELTKTLGKTDFETIVGPFIHKPPGNPILAPEGDKRPAFSPVDRAKAAFANE